MSPMEAIVNPPFRGSLLDADHPQNGVLIPRRFTRHQGEGLITRPNFASARSMGAGWGGDETLRCGPIREDGLAPSFGRLRPARSADRRGDRGAEVLGPGIAAEIGGARAALG